MTSSGMSRDRKAELDEFLSGLSPLELLYVRQKTKHANIVLAGLQHLPPELVCNIIPHIDLATFLACRRVSKAWARTLSQDAVIVHICRQISPGILETNRSEDPRKLLLDLLRGQKHQNSIRHLKSKHLQWDMNWDTPEFANVLPRPMSMPCRESQPTAVNYKVYYADGGVGWQPRRDLVIVDNLRTHKRHRIALTGLRPRLPYQLAAVSSQLIVLFTIQYQRPTSVIHVWHFQDRLFKTIHLPNAACQCYVDGDRVGAVTITGQIILWSWNGRAIQQNLEAVIDRPENVKILGPGLMFDSNDPESVYAVWHHTCMLSDQYISTFLVAQLKNGHVGWQSKMSLRNPLADCRDSCNHTENPLVRISFSPRKADDHGSYALGLYRLQSQQHTAPSPRVIHEGPWEMGDIGAVTFNVSTKTFSRIWYLFSEHEPFVWDPDKKDLRELHSGRSKFDSFEGAYLWDRHLLVMYTTHEAVDTPPQIKLEILRPNRYYFPGSEDYERRNLPDQMEITDGSWPVGEVFWDGDRVVVPTGRGLWVCEPRETGDCWDPLESLGFREMEESGFHDLNPLDQPDQHPDYTPFETDFHVQLNHG